MERRGEKEEKKRKKAKLPKNGGARTLLRLPGELLLAVVEEVGIEVLATEMGVTSSSLDGEDTALDVQERDIESTATKIVDENVALLAGLASAEAVGDSGGGGL